MSENADNMLSSLLSDPELSKRLSGVLSGMLAGSPAPQKTEGSSEAASPSADTADVMAKLPGIIGALRSALPSESKKSSPPREEDKRIALLCALRPYLSPGRQEAVDYIIKLSRVGDILSTLT